MQRKLIITENNGRLEFNVQFPLSGAQPAFWQIVAKIGSLELIELNRVALVTPTIDLDCELAVVCSVAKVKIPYNSILTSSLHSFTKFLADGLGREDCYLLPRWYGCSQEYCTEWYYLTPLGKLSVRSCEAVGIEADYGFHTRCHRVLELYLLDLRKDDFRALDASIPDEAFECNFLWWLRTDYKRFSPLSERIVAFVPGMSQPLPLTEWIVAEAKAVVRVETFWER